MKKNKWAVALRGACILCAVVAALASIALGFYRFNENSYDMALKREMGQAEKLSDHIIQIIQIEQERCIRILGVCEEFIYRGNGTFSDETMETLKQVQQTAGFRVLGVANLDGTGRDTNGHYTEGNLDPDLLEAARNGQNYVSDMLYATDEEEKEVVFAVPLWRQGSIAGVVYGQYPVEKLVEQINLSDADTCYFQIIDSMGKYIKRSENQYAFKNGATMWEELSNYTYTDEAVPVQVFRAVKSGESGSFSFTFDGEARYVSYCPIGINSWYVFAVQAQQEMDDYVHGTWENVISFFLYIAFGIGVLGLLAIYIIRKMDRLIREKNKRLELQNNLFQLILQKTSAIPLRIDLKRGLVYLDSLEYAGGMRTWKLAELAPEALKRQGILRQEDVPEYEKLYQTTAVSHQAGAAVLKLRMDEGMNWVKISTFESSQKEFMIGVLENYEKQKESEIEIERQQEEIQQISERAKVDFLTGIYNRETITEIVQAHMECGAENGAVCVLDLDHFKEVNDTLGHAYGDQVLCDAARSIEAAIGEKGSAGRIGGDEFMILLHNAGNLDEIRTLAARLCQLIRRTYEKDDNIVCVSASVGIAVFEHTDIEISAVIERADNALYEVKRAGRDGYRIYTRESG